MSTDISYKQIINQIAEMTNDGTFGDAVQRGAEKYNNIPNGIPRISIFLNDFLVKLPEEDMIGVGKCNCNGKRDRLLKHFDRLDILRSNISIVGKYVGIEDAFQIYGILVFKQPNVMEYAPQIPRNRIYVCSLDKLSEPTTLLPQLSPWI